MTNDDIFNQMRNHGVTRQCPRCLLGYQFDECFKCKQREATLKPFVPITEIEPLELEIKAGGVVPVDKPDTIGELIQKLDESGNSVHIELNAVPPLGSGIGAHIIVFSEMRDGRKTGLFEKYSETLLEALEKAVAFVESESE